MNELGERLRALRQEKGMTQEYLAERLQVSRQAVSKWERGLALPAMEKLLELSELFSVPLGQLAGSPPPAGGTAEAAESPSGRVWRRRFFAATAAAILLGGCLLLLCFWQWERRLPSETAAAGRPAYEQLSELVLGEELSHLADGSSVTIRLILSEGEYFTEEYEDYLPGGGVYAVNYRGSYRLEVLDRTGKSLCAYPLDEDFDGVALNFPGEVALSFFDYNWDGRPEFPIGQYGSSSSLLYALYTLGEDGQIIRCCPTLIADSRDIGNFSPLFPRGAGEEGKGFRASQYNNATGEMQETFYRWDGSAGQFLPEAE